MKRILHLHVENINIFKVLVEVLKKRIYRDPPFGILPGSLTSIGFFIPPPVICIEILNGGLVFFWKSLFLFDKHYKL